MTFLLHLQFWLKTEISWLWQEEGWPVSKVCICKQVQTLFVSISRLNQTAVDPHYPSSGLCYQQGAGDNFFTSLEMCPY